MEKLLIVDRPAPVGDECAQACELLVGARRVVVMTGAGMSQESGVPTFREAQTGLWARFDPLALASPEAFAQHPARVFGWYVWRLRLVQQAEPNAGHVALASLESAFHEFTLVSQNVDDLHWRAGSSSVVELHGSLRAFRCAARGHPFPASALDDIELPESGEVPPPACAQCGSPIRPGVVWFGEMLPADALGAAVEAAEHCDVLVSVGTSSVVYPAAGLPGLALAHGARVIEVNPEPTPLSEHATIVWRASAATALPALNDALRRAREEERP